jgi:hypothetical protein
MQTSEIHIKASDEPGILANICRALASAGVNLRAVRGGCNCACDCECAPVISVVVDNPTNAKAVLRTAGLKFTESPVFAVEVDDRVGVLADMAVKIADAGANLNTVYASSIGQGRSLIVFGSADVGKLANALNG